MYFDQFGYDPFQGAQDYYAQTYAALYWTVGLVIAACLIGVILYFTFLRRSNEGKFKGFWGRVYNYFALNRFYSEKILKLFGIVTFLILTFLGIYNICTGSLITGLLLLIPGNLCARLCYELTMMFIILVRKTVTVDKRLSGIEKFYSDDMKDWEAEKPEESSEQVSFEERLKEAFGDPEETPKYGYDEECKTCDNWDEVSEDCYCEDDCLTCEKPDKDAAEAKEEPAAEVADTVEEAVEEAAAPAEEVVEAAEEAVEEAAKPAAEVVEEAAADDDEDVEEANEAVEEVIIEKIEPVRE